MTEREEVLAELGRTAAERRESIGMTLETVFDRTKIRMEYLRGIESGNYEGFPEPVYIKGFIRTYLKLINAEDLQDEFMAQLDPSGGNTSRIDSSRKQEPRQSKNMKTILGNGSSIPKGFKSASHFWPILVLVLALIGTGVYVWYAAAYGGLNLKDLKLFKFAGVGGPLVVSATSSDTVLDGVDGEIESVTVSDDVSEDEEPGEEETPYLEIRAVNDVWLSVSFGNAQPVYRRTMKQGEAMRWDLAAPARVQFGRPSAAQIILNGQDLGIVNPRGRSSETHIYNPDGTHRQVTRGSR